MNAYGKTILRLFREHFVRLITIIAIVFVSVGVMSGISEVQDRIEVAADRYYESQNISDLYIKCARQTPAQGYPLPCFTQEELQALRSEFSDAYILESFCMESKYDDTVVRIYMQDLTANKVNKLELIEGDFPSSDNEVLAERGTDIYASRKVGDKIILTTPTGTREYTVSGITVNPLLLENTMEPSYAYEDENVGAVFYIHSSVLPFVNDVYVSDTSIGKSTFDSFSSSYKAEVNALKDKVYGLLGEDTANVLTLYENPGMYGLVSYAEKVGLIGIIFAVFFMLVTMLVVYSNMSRLFDEERGQIACLKTLGYSNFTIVFKYLLFVLCGTVIGGLCALPIGLGLTYLLYAAFHMQYAMPPFPGAAHLVYYIIAFILIIASMILLTYFTGMKIARSKPVSLLTPKAPKAGKRVILERIPLIWNRLSFKYKSTVRNVLLFKSRFFMTVISIIGSTVLVLAGFGLMDCAAKLSGTTAIIGIAVALIVFSALLCGLVIYNLTNINVSERKREIATLMVLGYHDKEVTGYVFREIYIMSILGALIGIPAGLGFLWFVFDLVNFGAIADINWWTWILAPAITVFFAFLSTLLLRRKILKTDMNASLKILE